MKRIAFIAAFLLIFLVSIRIPEKIAQPDLDGSLGLVFSYAHQHHGQFGTDYVSSYGPAAWLQSAVFLPATNGHVLIYDVLLYGLIALGIVRCAWRLDVGWRWLMVALTLLLPAAINDDPQPMVMVGIFCWGLLSLQRAEWAMRGLLMICLLACLGKFTFFCAGILTIAFVDIEGRGFFLSVVFAVCLALAWHSLGQHLSNFPSWIINSLHYTTGYAEANALPFLPETWFAAMMLAIYFLIQSWTTQRRVIAIWSTLLLYLAWKHGITRENLDGFAASSIVCLLALIPNRQAKKSSFAIPYLAMLAAVTLIAECRSGYFETWPKTVAVRITFNADALVWPSHYLAGNRSKLDTAATISQLPSDVRQLIGTNSVDVFGYHQGIAILDGMNYTPPPVCQGYQVFNRALSSLNERFYATNSPMFVLFRLETIDGRYLALDDGPLLADLILNYKLLANSGGFLILKRTGEKWCDARTNGLVMQIKTSKSMAERLRDLVWQPQMTAICVGNVQFRAPGCMVENGFLSRPIITLTADFEAALNR